MTLEKRAPELGSRPRPGRPRVEVLGDNILRATVELLDEGEDVTVSKVVERSGVSRAALYRRWPSIAQLTAAALDSGRTHYPELEVGVGLRESLIASFLPPEAGAPTSGAGYTMQRFNQRLKLILSDSQLQRAYWSSHVARRRAPLERSLEHAVEQGYLRADLDISACIDALAGVVYYQFIVRGNNLNAPATRARVRAAIDIIWNGMVV